MPESEWAASVPHDVDERPRRTSRRISGSAGRSMRCSTGSRTAPGCRSRAGHPAEGFAPYL